MDSANEKLRNRLLLAGAIGLLTTIALCLAYIYVFNAGISNENQKWGEFGDYFGGTAGAVFGLLSLLALLYTIYIQSIELRRSSTAQLAATSYSRLQALVTLHNHYLEEAKNQIELLKILNGGEGSMPCAERHDELNGLIREVRREISNYHTRVLGENS